MYDGAPPFLLSEKVSPHGQQEGRMGRAHVLRLGRAAAAAARVAATLISALCTDAASNFTAPAPSRSRTSRGEQVGFGV